MSGEVIAAVAFVALVIVLALWKASHRSSVLAQVVSLGFAPCEAEAPGLQQAFLRLAGGYASGKKMQYEISQSTRKNEAGKSVYHFTAHNITHLDSHWRHNMVPPQTDVFLIELGQAKKDSPRPASVFLAPPMGALGRRLIQQVVDLRALGARLTIPAQHTASMLAAFGADVGSLHDHLSATALERLSRGGKLGIMAVHFGEGKAAFECLPEKRDVAAQWSYVREWL